MSFQIIPSAPTPELCLDLCRFKNATCNLLGQSISGPIDVIVQTLKSEGLAKGLYRGNTATLLREIPGNFCWYGTYEGVCKLMTPEGGTKKDLGPPAHLLGGAAAGVMYWTAFYPAGTCCVCMCKCCFVKNVLRVQHVNLCSRKKCFT